VCCSAYKLYHKKLALSLASIVMDYTSSLGKSSLLLAFNCLLKLFPKKALVLDETNEIHALFELTLKKMYNEFTRVSKFGGGALKVQDKLIIC